MRITILFCLAGVALAQQPAYLRPAIATRGAIPHFGLVEGAPRIRLFTHVNGFYGTGLSAASSTAPQNGEPDDITYGAEAGIGASGYHRWERTTFGLDYHSSFRRYPRRRVDDGGDHLLTLGFIREIGPRWKLNLAESAGIFRRQFLYNPFSSLDPGLSNVPRNDVFDDRTHFLSTVAEIGYERNPRLSFNLGGRGYLVRRKAQSLVGLNAYQGNIGLNYGLSARRTIGLDYGFSRYTYTRLAGRADVQAVGIGYAQRLGRSWDFNTRVGGYQINRNGLERTLAVPSLTPILGSEAIQAGRAIHYLPAFEARFRRQLHHGSATLAYSRGVDPGNGVYLLSQREGVDGGYTYARIQRLRLGVDAGFGRHKSLTDNAGPYRVARAGGGLVFKLVEGLHLMARFDANQFNVPRTDFVRERYRVTFGVAFASKEVALQ